MKPKHSRQAPQLSFLLAAPSLAVLLLAAYAVVALFAGMTLTWWQALSPSLSSYPVVLAACLFIEDDDSLKSVASGEPLRILVGLGGLVISAVFLFRSYDTHALSDLRFGIFSAIASAATVLPRRTERVRALAFGLMAIAETHRPLLALSPPFVSLGLLSAFAAAVCLIRAGVTHRLIRRVFTALPALFLAVSGVYGLPGVYRAWPPIALVLYVAAILFFGIGTVVIMARGTSWERR